jgi:hypothetical protein
MSKRLIAENMELQRLVVEKTEQLLDAERKARDMQRRGSRGGGL